VNSLLLFIDRMEPRGFVVAATNLDASLDPAIWRPFDEVMWFEKPARKAITDFVAMKLKNMQPSFRTEPHLKALQGNSYADIQRVCSNAMRFAIVERREVVTNSDFLFVQSDKLRRPKGGQVRRSAGPFLLGITSRHREASLRAHSRKVRGCRRRSGRRYPAISLLRRWPGQASLGSITPAGPLP
jgi:SpoVK/Ycf46/Vps4 family AAA+-type ATPase